MQVANMTAAAPVCRHLTALCLLGIDLVPEPFVEMCYMVISCVFFISFFLPSQLDQCYLF